MIKAGLITIDNGLLAVTAKVSVTVTVKLSVPACVGDPEIVPVVAFSVRPGGNAPVLFDQV